MLMVVTRRSREKRAKVFYEVFVDAAVNNLITQFPNNH